MRKFWVIGLIISLGMMAILIGVPLGNTQPLTAKPLPDLSIGEVFLDEDCQVNVEVKNIGSGPVPDEVWTVHKPESAGVYLQVLPKGWGGGATIWGFDPGKSLQPPGGRAVYKSNLKISGAVTVEVTVDKTLQVAESNERNNVRKVDLTCKVNLPDLIVKMKVPTTIFREKGMFKIDLTVTNIGTTKAGDSVAEVVITPAPPGKAMKLIGKVPPLDPGKSFTVSFSVGVPKGKYELCGLADATNVVIESNEGNNKFCQGITVKEK